MMLKGLMLHADVAAGPDANSLVATVSVVDSAGELLWKSDATPLTPGETLVYGPFAEEVTTEAELTTEPTRQPAPSGGGGASPAKASAAATSPAKPIAKAGPK